MPISPSWGQSALNIVPGTMSLGLMGSQIGRMNTMFDPKVSNKKKTKNMLDGFTETMMGIPLISATSTAIGAL